MSARCLRFKPKAFREAYRNDRDGAMKDLLDGIKAGEFRFGEGTSFEDVYESLTDGDLDQALQSSKFATAFEAADAVGVADARLATGQFLLHEAQQGWDVPGLIGDMLCSPRTATTIEGSPAEKIPYWPLPSANDDDAYVVKEGDPYRRVGMPVGFIEFVGAGARGAMIELTRQLLIMDKTGGGLAQNARQQSEGLRIYREKQQLSQELGVTGSWRFAAHDGAISTNNTYATSGIYTNSYANTLSDWNSFKTLWLKLSAMTDPVTSQVISTPGNITVVVPPALFLTAKQIINATNVGQIDNQANSSTVRFFGANPVSDLPMTITVLCNQFVKVVTSSDSTWYAGDFKAAFRNCIVWQFEQREQGSESDASFERDVPFRFRFGYCELVQPMYPFRVTKNT